MTNIQHAIMVYYNNQWVRIRFQTKEAAMLGLALMLKQGELAYQISRVL